MPQLEIVLWKHFHDYVRQYHYGGRFNISRDGEVAIREFIANGVTEIDRLSYSPDQVEDSKSKLLLFANEMIRLAKRRNTHLLTSSILTGLKKNFAVALFC
jgi:hypothetical protein